MYESIFSEEKATRSSIFLYSLYMKKHLPSNTAQPVPTSTKLCAYGTIYKGKNSII